MKILTCVLLALISFSALAQKSHEQMIQEFLNQRKQMMKDVMKAFDDDSFFDDDFDDSSLFDQISKQGLSGFNGFNTRGKNIKIVEKINNDGTIIILITPANDKVKLDIETTVSFINIKSEQLNKTSSSHSQSSYSQSISIPRGFKAQAPSQEGKTIKIALVPTKSKSKIFYPKVKDNSNIKPIGKRKGEGTI
jgi:hypothetical protein